MRFNPMFKLKFLLGRNIPLSVWSDFGVVFCFWFWLMSCFFFLMLFLSLFPATFSTSFEISICIFISHPQHYFTYIEYSFLLKPLECIDHTIYQRHHPQKMKGNNNLLLTPHQIQEQQKNKQTKRVFHFIKAKWMNMLDRHRPFIVRLLPNSVNSLCTDCHSNC